MRSLLLATSVRFKIRNVLSYYVFSAVCHYYIQYPEYFIFIENISLKSPIYLQVATIYTTRIEPMYPPALCENMRQLQTSCLFQLICFLQKMIEKFSFNCIGPEPMDICTTSTSQPCEFLKSDVTILEGHKSEVKYFLNASCLCFGFFC